MARYDELMKEAQALGEMIETEWAEENESKYDAFAEKIEAEYAAGNITDREHDDLALTAFYDYFDLLCEVE